MDFGAKGGTRCKTERKEWCVTAGGNRRSYPRPLANSGTTKEKTPARINGKTRQKGRPKKGKASKGPEKKRNVRGVRRSWKVGDVANQKKMIHNGTKEKDGRHYEMAENRRTPKEADKQDGAGMRGVQKGVTEGVAHRSWGKSENPMRRRKSNTWPAKLNVVKTVRRRRGIEKGKD